MTGGPYQSSPVLTHEQRTVVEQPADAMLLITAGAGTGKTHTLVRRIEALISDGSLSPGDVLVLTFSRAAVRELQERLSVHPGHSRSVRATTFDSWALEILAECAADVDWGARPFDERIREATKLISDAGTAPEWLGELGHVLIDEVQDLVGDRRELVEVLLESYDCGFTAVGDPAQAIYGFQVADPAERGIEVNRFFDWLRRYFVDDLIELSLTCNFRARTAEARSALRFETEARSCASMAEAERLHEELRTELAARMDFGDVTVPFIRESLVDCDVTTAVLCRTNGEALLISAWFHDVGIPHQLRRAAQDRVAPVWLNEVVLAARGALALNRQRFDELCSSSTGPVHDGDREQIWRLLRSCAGDRAGRSIDLSRLSNAIAMGRLPDALTGQPPHTLVISTYHRAKGLEFDRVLVVDPGRPEVEKFPSDADAADRSRALYVAMTRTREDLYRLEPPPEARPDHNGFRLVRRDRQTQRWARFGYQPWKRLGLEVLGGDIHTRHPGGTHQFTDDAIELQQHLHQRVDPGDPVELVRFDEVAAEHDERLSPGYALLHGQRTIGVASGTFRRDLYRHLQQSRSFRPRNWPRRITGLRLDAVETVAGERTAGVRAGLGDLGVWLAPRPIGLGRFHYDSMDKD